MDPAVDFLPTPAVNNHTILYHARQFVNAYAIHHNFAVKNGVDKDKEKTLLLFTNDYGLTRHKDARNMLCDHPWMALFKKQLNDTWFITQLVDQHDGHQLEGINPRAYPENRPLTAAPRETMLDLVQHSTASFNAIASVLNTTHGLSLLGRDVYNRSYDYTQKGTDQQRKIHQDIAGRRLHISR
ncbi:hypothetical protein POJ06DRAFT_280652 [Lipomyces tetrasporus]|uniref:Uncharacterized protein n=1 Tax=Lipomyces tetrasporus TaxID=54092 RepID=A0AAD7QVE7_9ASCO|nr:uncharacterized protein POJ06DRAFT_280652 [Lipomyces tetrasporus]KAJ8102033.1 hypothetical protein POJ06DRAFT_280652 [Lipomyces tetrasporus]